MDISPSTNDPDFKTIITKNYEIISKISRVQGKHMVLEISKGAFVMNEFSSNDLLLKVKNSYDSSIKSMNGSITYRDCKMMFSDLEYVHSIDPRFECILVRLFPLSCIILKSSVLVIVNENMKMDTFINDLCRITHLYSNYEHKDSSIGKKNSTTSDSSISSCVRHEESQIIINLKLPFEISVLECCLITAISHLETDLISYENKYKILEEKVYDNKKFKDISILLHELKHPVSNLHEVSKGLEELIDDILDSEVELKALEFSNHTMYYGVDSLKNSLSYREVNTDLRFLLEYFDQEIEQINKRTKTLQNSLLHMERYISLELSITRNEMMRLEVMCSILGVSFGIGACLSGLFGMNVINGFENNHYAFFVITAVFLIFLIVAIYITRVLKIRHRV